MSKDQLQDPAEEFFPSRKSLKAFRDAAADCKACDLWKRGTQTVFGEGSRRAEVFFVGEQPEIAACRPWLEAEIALVKPQVIFCLGATAAQALLGPRFLVSKQRGQFIESTLAPYIMATVHFNPTRPGQ